MGVPIVEFSVPSSLSGEKFEKNVKLIEEGCVGRGAFVILVSMHIFPLFIRPLRKYIYRNDLQKENQFIFFNRIIFDDFHSGEKAFNAHYNGKVSGGFLWFINSTPELIQISRLNSLHYMSSLCPGSSIDNSYHVVNVPVPESTYVLPECVVRTILYRDSTAVARLGEGFPREVVECMEMGDFNGAYNLMAGVPLGTTIPPENRIPIHQLAMARYSNLLDQLRDRQAKLIELGHSTENVEQQIEKTEREMEVLQERIKGFASENIECPICLSETEPQSRVIVKCCSNIFCGECMGKTIRLNGRCPMCREKVGLGSIYSMDENGNVIDLNDYQRNRGKGVGGESSEPRSPMEALENLLRENPEGKFVVFAKNESSSSGYKRYFNTESRILEDVTGSVTKIQNTLREFREGGLRVLFLSSKTSNAGLNLQFATDVVIIGSSLTNEGDINQSLGRVRRFPRREPVPVHYIKRI